MRLATALLFATLSGGLLAAESHSHFDARIGYHLVDPYDLSTHRYLLELSEKWEPISGWTLWAGARGMVAGVAQEQTQEVWLRDTFLQYRNDWLTVRAGNQRVVWGEVFGFYYADIVNPKDMRELGLGDLSLNRLSVPMIDVVVSFSAAALEFLAIPRPVFSKMPSVVGDFAFPFHDVVSSGSVSFGEDSGKDLSLSNAEFGLRGSKQWSGTDLSLFYFYYWDRIPTFTAFVVTPSPLSVSLTPFHARLSTVGLTASHDFSPFVLRLEGGGV
ncbi:MAG: hypothetical protein HYR96_02875 [Deltaproteobacteria bacterium]|nr:hypothetical protein [Deltaproteobacteria bacterium]